MALFWHPQKKSSSLSISNDMVVLTQGPIADGSGGYVTGNQMQGFGLIGRTSGKYYFEMKALSITSNTTFGFSPTSMETESRVGSNGPPTSYGWKTNGDEVNLNSTNIGAWGAGDIIGIAIDRDSATKTVKVYKNGVLGATATMSSTTATLFPAATPGQRVQIYGNVADLTYLPAGYSAWDGSSSTVGVECLKISSIVSQNQNSQTYNAAAGTYTGQSQGGSSRATRFAFTDPKAGTVLSGLQTVVFGTTWAGNQNSTSPTGNVQVWQTGGASALATLNFSTPVDSYNNPQNCTMHALTFDASLLSDKTGASLELVFNLNTNFTGNGQNLYTPVLVTNSTVSAPVATRKMVRHTWSFSA